MDSKYTVMQQMPKKYCPETQFLLSDILNQTYSFPIIIKPTINSGNGKGIVVVRSQTGLNSFLDTCKDPGEYMVQNYLDDHKVEIGVLYERMPWSDKGRIIEICEKPEKSEIRNSVDVILDISHLITPELDEEFRRISANIPGFYVGRYDIRLKHIDDLHILEFKIVEVNGTFGSGLSFYCDEKYKYVDYYLFKWYIRRIILGIYNMISFRGYSPIELPMVMMKTYYNMVHYNEFGLLFYLSS
jgi:glutathione synthase/RimK-type ligase-like ATP-grasp enzyme